jgi:hypothetical protein
MNRRGFLATLFGAAASPLLKRLPAPERRIRSMVALAKAEEAGVTMRFVRTYDPLRGYVNRIDVMCGFAPSFPDPSHVCVVRG